MPNFLLEATDSARQFEGTLGDGPALVTGGYGGWDLTQRPRGVSLTDWAGKDPLQLTIPFMLDQYESGDVSVVERNINILEGFAGMDPTEDEPAQVRLIANGVIPHDSFFRPNSTWVVNDITWDAESVIRNNVGRLRQAGTVTLLEFVDSDTIEVNKTPAQKKRSKSKKGSQKKGAKEKSYTIRQGDTLSKIAARELGNANRWRELAQMNNLRDPDHLKVGQRIRLP